MADRIPERESGHLLVIDDTEMIRDMVSRRLAKRGSHTVLVAEDGLRGLEMIEEHDFDLVLLDIMMPGLDGYQVLAKIREEYAPSDLPVIMATAKDQSEDIVGALKLGANDYVTKPFDFPVVLARVQTQLVAKRSRDALAAAHEKMKKDLEAAARIQQTFLPNQIPEVKGARFAWRYLPCDELAGDTLNIIPLDESRVAVFVIDVSGHGVPSALLSVTLSRLMSGAAETSSVLWTSDEGATALRIASPVEVVESLAQRFPYNPETRQYFTLVYGVLDLERRELCYVSAGHPPIVQVRGGCDPFLHQPTGPPVGLIPPGLLSVQYSEETIRLEVGDRVYFYSDGIPEANNPEGEELEVDRVTEVLVGLSDTTLDESVSRLLEHVEEWVEGPASSGDDVSILAVEIEN